ncbi:hypothetical protein [Bacillus sp. FJAT-27251]|uniref:hypothetical protein n=1 Tax=Bacillus sp. FJAT-27251 TaxID=1684142 RepID=UPI0006A7BCB5|nr:hypothetical protein [Bacillus sp. FJAT-27251]
MDKFKYVVLNSFMMAVIFFLIMDLIQKEEEITGIIFIVLASIIIINILVFILDFLLKRFDLFLKKRKQKNYSLYDWLSDPNLISSFTTELTTTKRIDSKNFYSNYNLTKQILKNHFKKEEDLRSFKIYLEMITESPRYNAILTASQSIIVAIIVSLLLILFNNNDQLSHLELYSRSIIFIMLWICLLSLITFFSKEIDRNKILLKLVNECILEIQPEKTKVKNYD